jgi:phage/plasmid-like protein (TIGR03299 family)
MAHELDMNQTTGKRSMFSVNETPWHREGVILAEAPTLAEAHRLAGTDFEVKDVPLYISERDTNLVTSVGFAPTGTGKAIIRTDTRDVLGIVGDDYTPLQNSETFAVLEPLLDRGVATLETGGTLSGGRDVWMMVKFNIDDAIVREAFGNEVVPFGLLTNNHSAKRRALLMETPTRVVCRNTLNAALRAGSKNMVSVTHRGDARVRVVEAAEQMFAKLTARYRIIAEDFTLMKATRLTVDQFTRSVLNVVAPLPVVEPGKVAGPRFDSSLAKASYLRAVLTQAWNTGSGHVADSSAWEAYNGAVEVMDHDDELFKVRGSRVESMLLGSLATKKSALVEAVLAECRG